MNDIIYKIDNNKLDLELHYKKYFNIEKLQNEKLKELIINNSEKINKFDIEIQLNDHLEQNYKDVDLHLSCEVGGEIYNSGYDMLNEIDETYYKLTSLLEEFDNKFLTIELNEMSKDYYKFMYDNFEIIGELLGE